MKVSFSAGAEYFDGLPDEVFHAITSRSVDEPVAALFEGVDHGVLVVASAVGSA